MDAHKGLLVASGTHERVDRRGLDVVKLLHGLLDLVLVGTDIGNEDEGLVVLNLLHGRLGREGVLDNGKLIKDALGLDSVAGVLGLAGDRKRLGEVEGHRGAEVASTLRGGALNDSLLGSLGLSLGLLNALTLGGRSRLGSSLGYISKATSVINPKSAIKQAPNDHKTHTKGA